MRIGKRPGSKIECGSRRIVLASEEGHTWTKTECCLLSARLKWPRLKKMVGLALWDDADLFSVATEGSYAGENGRVKVGVTTAGANT
jgi:hypothetical protein